MQGFGRYLEDGAQQTLAAIIDSPAEHWWKDFLTRWQPSGSENGLRLALRRNYMNFYLCGQSVGRVGFDHGGMPYVETHAKYAFGEEQLAKYVRLSGNRFVHPGTGVAHSYEGMSTLIQWVKRAASKAGEEKRFVERVVAENASVIDLEMALPAFDDRRRAPRIDLVALEQCADRIKVVFWEAKLVKDSRLVARGRPEVLTQLEDYKQYMADSQRRKQVAGAYANTCAQTLRFHDMAQRLGLSVRAADPMVIEVARDSAILDIDPVPRLLILDDGSTSEARRLHLERLRSTEFGAPVPIVMAQSDAAIKLCRPEAVDG